jgi:hypothetical protein
MAAPAKRGRASIEDNMLKLECIFERCGFDGGESIGDMSQNETLSNILTGYIPVSCCIIRVVSTCLASATTTPVLCLAGSISIQSHHQKRR